MPDRKWWKEAVIYQIYPRSFKDSNGDGIGDLNGIAAKLDYIASLGIDVVWLNPVYASPNEDNGYDISDFKSIMPEFGSMADFDRLLEGLHDRGIKLIHATYSHLAEIDAGNLAARKATADSIKMFGQMMVSDHTAAQNSLDSTANYVDIPIPKMLDLAHRALAQLLSSLSGHAFDSAYIKSRIAEHKTALRLFKTEIDHGVNIRIKSYASNYLPKI